ncbi:hypothetical protein HPB51_007565 [Rhipicephalus microplus]|uniref:Uncharacterized protein n=1 Tax=Rhipicephalus microplus TaxID=6941 RepID=A0A9J6D4D8_RHIMP|nr:hypothetical protein HPB51_007565 [Rhipicephalus microplus]
MHVDASQNGSCGGEHESAGPGAESSRDGVPWEREVETGRLHFVKFETRHIEAWLRFVQEELLRDGSPPRLGGSVKLTGGGAFRHRQLIAATLGLRQVLASPRGSCEMGRPHDLWRAQHSPLKGH